MLGCNRLLMQATSLFDGSSFDGFPPFENGRSSAEADIGRRQVGQAIVVSAIVVASAMASASRKLFFCPFE
jgi:hypothetical protein